MIVTRTPHRISLLGGGTDFRDYYLENGGLTLSFAIDKYVYVTLKDHGDLFNESFRVVYSKTELVNQCSDIENSIVRACFEYFGLINKKIYVSSISDLPSGTGLGSSSAFAVGLILAIHKYLNITCTHESIADLACKIEIDVIGKKIGKQDQFGCAFPGVKIIEFKKNDSVQVKQNTKLSNFFSTIEHEFSLIWTGETRSADPILAEQTKNIIDGYITDHLKSIHNSAENFISNFDSLDFNKAKSELKKLITYSWFEKKEITKNFNNKHLENIDRKLLDLFKKDMIGYKLSGAGGGGFFTVIGGREYVNELFGNRVYNIKFDNQGSVLITI